MAESLTSVPVLLGGENRSGTTLFSVVLDSHPDLVVGPELDFVDPENLGPHIIEACELLLAGDERVLGPGTDVQDPFWYHGTHFVKQCQRFGIEPDVLRALTRDVMSERHSDLETMVDRCRLIEVLGEYRREGAGVGRWGIKLQRKIAHVDMYASIWPAAHFVHIIRDGRDVAASHLTTVTWGYRQLTDAAKGWLEVVERPNRVAPPDRYLEIRYEDLVTSPRQTLKQVVDFLGIPWRDELLDHSALDHSLFRKSWGHPAAEAASRPLYQEQIGRYRKDLSPEETRQFEDVAGHELVRAGYVLSGSR